MDILSFELGKKLGGGGQPSPTPTPSTGYVEDGLLVYYDGNAQEAVQYSKTATFSSATNKIIDINKCNPSDGATIEGYILMSGASSASSYSRGFNVGTGGTEFCLGFGNGGSSGSDYRFNPMVYWGASMDYEIYPSGLYYGDKHTFAIVSTPNIDPDLANITTFYIDGVQVGDSRSQSRNSTLILTGVIVEGGTSRPLNGKLYNGRFYTRALTTAELAANHANDVAKYGGNG